MNHRLLNILTTMLFAGLMIACTQPKVPADYTTTDKVPDICPDYTDVTVPCNICPTNFYVRECDEAVARLTAGDISFTYGEGADIVIPEDDWAEMLNEAKGSAITVEVFARKDAQWYAYRKFHINVAKDSIDPYISYRLIQPSYVSYEDLAIVQRNITNFDEEDIYNNMSLSTESNGQCINCHSYQNYSTQRMLFHMRQAHGGTIIYDRGNLLKVNLKTDSTISAGVYPAWHPTLDVIAFSTNLTGQIFHTKDHNKVEVQDTYSDLILYNVETNEVSTVLNDTTELEVFPAWSPDGKTLYYCSAHFEYADSSLTSQAEMMRRYKEVKYSIYSMPFNAQTLSFGEKALVYDAAGIGKSATLPRLSPDGQYLVFAEGEYGCFHVWHNDADIRLLKYVNGQWAPQPDALKALNSSRSESYPSFSSNGRWIMCNSRRDDGNYTRPYIAYFDASGRCHKAFEVPQRNPHHLARLLKSFNRPEFMKEPVQTSLRTLTAKAKTEALQAKQK